MSANTIIEIRGLSKRYAHSRVYALHSLSLQVNQGEIYGFLGPNGAGKSTTIRLLMNFIQPTAGSAAILGKDAVKENVAVKRRLGYLSSDPAMYGKLTGRQFLDYMEELQPAASKAYRQELSKRLKADLNKPLGSLSRGNRQKVGLIQAFMHQPDVLILDEPSSGLDPLMQEVFYDLLREAKQRGATIFTSSHNLSEVQKVCDRIGFIREGKLIAERAIAEMMHEAAHTFYLTFASEPPIEELKRLPGAEVAGRHGNDVTLHLHGKLAPLFRVLARHDVIKIDSQQLDLEEVFLRFYKGEEAAK
jgi:ABC-type multidrug transport system ATPase subunit